MEDEELIHEHRDNIEISKNAKDEVAWKVKRYYDADTRAFVDIVDELKAIHEALKERFL